VTDSEHVSACDGGLTPPTSTSFLNRKTADYRKRMKITIENEYRTVTADADGVSADEYVEVFADLMVALGFCQGTVMDGLRNYLESRGEVADG